MLKITDIDYFKIHPKLAERYSDRRVSLNDIDNLAALIANLDVVISAQTWVGDFAAALGVEVFKFHNPLSLTRLGQRNIPWNNSTIFDIKNNSWKDSFELIKSLLNKRIVK